MAVQLGGRNAGDIRDVVGVGQRRAGKGVAAEDALPPFDEVEPVRTGRKTGVLDAGLVRRSSNHLAARRGDRLQHYRATRYDRRAKSSEPIDTPPR
jgi:hypothetical protein